MAHQGIPASWSSTPAPAAHPGIRILQRLLAGLETPPAVRLWNGLEHRPQPAPEITIVVRDPVALRRLVLRPTLLELVDAYFQGALDIEGDLFQAIALREQLATIDLSWPDRLALVADALRLSTQGAGVSRPAGTLTSRIARRFRHLHTRFSDRAAIRFHYDVSNDFYGLWLDAERVYSCAYFEHPDESLETAQRNKLELICRKLRLCPGERLLDIGCGWGALVCWAARHHGVRAHGITLSRQQFEFARARIRDEGLEDRVTVELRDYRDLAGEALYDKVASVGMFEHVGLANLPGYYATVRRLLRPGGLFLNHGITHDADGWGRTFGTELINRYVFPGGELDRIGNIQLGMERAGFEIHDVEGLRPHYALTLRHWVQRLEAGREAALQLVEQPVYRVWRLYMAACALAFEQGRTGVYQVLASKRNGGAYPLPLTRRDLYIADTPTPSE